MTIELSMPRRFSSDENFGPIPEEPVDMIETAEVIQEISKKNFQLCMDRDECLCNLRFSVDSSNQEKLEDRSISTNPSFWRCQKTVAKKFWKQIQEIENQRIRLFDEIVDFEKNQPNQKINKTNLIFQNFWAEQNGHIYKSLETYNQMNLPCCVIL